MTVKKVKHLFEHWNSKCDLWHSYDADRLKRTSCLQLKDIQQCWAIPKMHLVLRGGSSIFFLTEFPFSAVSGRRKRERGGSEKKKKIQHTIRIHLVDHVLQLSFCGVLSQRPHHCAQFLGGDGAITILVEQWERLLELYTNDLSHVCQSLHPSVAGQSVKL